MKLLRRIVWLGLFAAAGTGVAICIAFSAPPPPDDQELPAAELAEEGHQEEQPDAPAAPHPPWEVPSRAVVATSYPAVGQQVVSEAGKKRLQMIFDSLRRQVDPAAAATAPSPAPPSPPGGVVAGPPPAASAGLSSPLAPLSAQATVSGEGDGLLSMNFPNNDIRDVLEDLSEWGNLNILASSSVQGKVSATLNGVDIDSALDAILKSTGFVARREGKFIYVGTPQDFEMMEHALDKIGTRVYRPNYVSAAELNTLITPLLTEGVGVASVTSPAESGIAADSTTVGGDTFAGGDALVVRDYEAVLAEIDQVVTEIDVRPMQVHIEAMILSVKLKDGNEFGVNFELLRDNDHTKLGWGTVPEKKEALTTTVLNDAVDMAKSAAVDGLARVALDGTGLKFGFLDSSLGAFLNALETVGDVNVIATPRLMAINKQRAEILIGEELGYVSTTVTENSATQTVDFLNVGAQLRLRPFISTDGLIRMEVHPELSTGAVTVQQGFTLPNKETTQVTTNIMVRDGCTVVIGGLMREELETSTAQVPLLGSLPLIGAAFRSKTEKLRRHEVLVLITPRIVYEPEVCEEGEKAACEAHRRQAVYANQMSPLIGKRSIGRRYFRYAQNAWAAGDRDLALRFAEMAVHFDPLNRAAIDLRSDIWLGRPHGEHTLGADQPAPLSGPLDGQTIAPWLLDELEQAPLPQPAPHPRDPGQPGSHVDVVRPRRFP